jgi:hypothetical protein
MDVVLLFMLHVQARRRRQEELEKQRQEEQLRKQQVTFHFICQTLFSGIQLNGEACLLKQGT